MDITPTDFLQRNTDRLYEEAMGIKQRAPGNWLAVLAPDLAPPEMIDYGFDGGPCFLRSVPATAIRMMLSALPGKEIAAELLAKFEKCRAMETAMPDCCCVIVVADYDVIISEMYPTPVASSALH